MINQEKKLPGIETRQRKQKIYPGTNDMDEKVSYLKETPLQVTIVNEAIFNH